MIRASFVGIVAWWLAQATPEPIDRGPHATSSTTLIVSVGDAATGGFIVDAEVRLPSLGRSARTRWDGEARFRDLTGGRYHVQVRALGYAPGDIDAELRGDSIGIHFALERISAELDTVRVVDKKPSLRLAAFETRRRAGIGRFLTDSILAADKTQSLAYVLATRFPGISVRENGIVSTQPSGLIGDNGCPVLIFLDGIPLEGVNRVPFKGVDPTANDPFGRGGRSSKPGAGKTPMISEPPPADLRKIADLQSIRPDELVGVEVYSRTSAPQEYRPLGNYCKVVLLWTRF